MKILLIYDGLGGVQWHRLHVPMERMQLDGHAEVLHTTDLANIDPKEIQKLSQFDVAIFNGNITETMKCQYVFAMLKSQGVRIVIDVDDYWVLPKGHPVKPYFDYTRRGEATPWQIRNADEVWTTNGRLKKECLKYNKHVCVIPNSIDPEKSPLEGNEYTDKVFYQGSVTHREDLRLIKEMEITIVGAGKVGGDYDPEWKRIMDMMPNAKFEDAYSDVREYHKLYLDKGISVIPLVRNKFNSYKSSLKVIESGWYSKPVIVSNVPPYSGFGKHFRDLIYVDHPQDFYKRVEALKGDRAMQDDLRLSLNDLIKRKYMIWHTNQLRLQRLTALMKRRITGLRDM